MYLRLISWKSCRVYDTKSSTFVRYISRWYLHERIIRFSSVYDEGGVKLKNPNIELMDQDILYHLALGNESHDLVEMFGDVKVSDYQINDV